MYLDKYRDSCVAVNLKACNTFRMYNGKAAEAEVKALAEASGEGRLGWCVVCVFMGQCCLTCGPSPCMASVRCAAFCTPPCCVAVLCYMVLRV